MIRTGQKLSGTVSKDQNWSETIMTGQKRALLVRNVQNWSGLVRKDQDTSQE